MTVDDLARRTDLPVRTIREYHAMRLLPTPAKRGRVGFYGPAHVQRLQLIGRLQRRGYSLAGIRDLLGAWESGSGLASVLGVERGPVTIDEIPLRLTRAELVDRIPEFSSSLLRRAQAVGLVVRDGRSHFLVRSPALLDLVADGARLGVPMPQMLDQVEILTSGLDVIARALADKFVDTLWRPMKDADNAGQLPDFLARGRLLLLQGASSILADRLGDALLHQATEFDGGEALRAAVERIRAGVVATGDGTIKRREAHG